jgi:hypothetical protein
MQFWSSLVGRLLGRVPCVRRRVLVNLVSDDAIDGVLWRHTGAWLVLKHAAHTTADGKKRTTLDGDVVIECAKVSFIQVCAVS